MIRFTNLLTFVRGVLVLAAGMVLVFGLALLVDLNLAGQPLSRVFLLDLADARQLNNLLNRSLNQLVAVVFTTVAIAVPLTANLYSLKFLEFFIKDWVNAAVLLFVVFTDVANLGAGLALKADLIPVILVYLLLGATVLCFALLFPYLYHVFRFLHPHTLLTRLEHELADHLHAARRQPGPRRAAAAAALEHIANIGIRSVERGDRNTAVESIASLDRVLRAYWPAKAGLPAAWFLAEQDFFLGFSSAAMDDLTASRAWVEMKIFGQLHQLIGAAVGRLPEVTRTAAKTLRQLSLEPAARADAAVRDLTAEHFNTLLRLALNRRDARAVFTVFDQYRLYAEAINAEHPEFGLEIAYYFQYYGQVARDTGQTFLVETAAYDLGALVQAAWAAGAPNRAALLERFLHYDDQARQPLRGVKKAQAILASHFLMHDLAEPADQIRAHWADLEPAFIRQVRDELLAVRREKYWEITERRRNIDYVPDAQRAQLGRFFETVLGAG
ncbi:MAG: DUF2254 domain-containing protein [Anaerolineales bacterium]|nr:DUF2254 domain-containing protein [Anaerolineales bacterium]